MQDTRKAFIALAAVAITMGAIWHTHRLVPPEEATWGDVRAEAGEGGYRLIVTDELFKKFAAEPEALLLVDTRQEWEYRTGHIRGALNFPIEPTWLSRWRNRGPLKKFLGPDKYRLIVFY